MMTNSKNIEITAALFFFKRRHESWIKFKEGAGSLLKHEFLDQLDRTADQRSK